MLLPDWPFTFQAIRSDRRNLVKKKWRAGSLDSLGPRLLDYHLYIIFVFLGPFPHAFFLSAKSVWEGENADHPCIVSSTVPAININMSRYFIHTHTHNFVCFLQKKKVISQRKTNTV